MKFSWRALAAATIGFGAIGIAGAEAKPRIERPVFCDDDHDHRSHHADYYDYYDHDQYYRAGPYRGSDASLTISIGDPYNRRYSRYDRGRRNGYHDDRGRRLHRQSYDTGYYARIVLTEEIVHTRRGPQLVCNVRAQGPEARYVSDRRLRAIARNECSRSATIRVYS